MSPYILKKGDLLSRTIDDYPEGIVISVDKPLRWTSADVIRKIKWCAGKHFGKKNLKVGHAGTLDPLASGVLLVCIGKATKLAESLQAREKQYVAGISFGATTPSYDLEKDIDRICPLEGISREALENVLESFIGEQDQVAPLFSAKSVDGVRAYEMARKLLREGKLEDADGILRSSRITISGLELLSFSGPQTAAPNGCTPPENANAANSRIHVADISGYELIRTEVLVDCSKGTYIRALARDLGEALGSGAFLHSLRRTAVGKFRIGDALSMEDVLASMKRAEE